MCDRSSDTSRVAGFVLNLVDVSPRPHAHIPSFKLFVQIKSQTDILRVSKTKTRSTEPAGRHILSRYTVRSTNKHRESNIKIEIIKPGCREAYTAEKTRLDDR